LSNRMQPTQKLTIVLSPFFFFYVFSFSFDSF